MNVVRNHPWMVHGDGFCSWSDHWPGVLGWSVWPVEWTDATPGQLAPQYQEAYVKMVSELYAFNGNAEMVQLAMGGWAGDVSGDEVACSMAASNNRSLGARAPGSDGGSCQWHWLYGRDHRRPHRNRPKRAAAAGCPVGSCPPSPAAAPGSGSGSHILGVEARNKSSEAIGVCGTDYDDGACALARRRQRRPLSGLSGRTTMLPRFPSPVSTRPIPTATTLMMIHSASKMQTANSWASAAWALPKRSAAMCPRK